MLPSRSRTRSSCCERRDHNSGTRGAHRRAGAGILILGLMLPAVALAAPAQSGSPIPLGAAYVERASPHHPGERSDAPPSSPPSHPPGSAHVAIPVDGTPVVDPPVEAEPIYLPIAQSDHDPLLPAPIEARLKGWLALLTPEGRSACHPARHVLLDRPEGERGAAAIAVLAPVAGGVPGRGPNLDLYAGEHVEVVGPISMAPAGCVITRSSMEVVSIELRETPPR